MEEKYSNLPEKVTGQNELQAPSDQTETFDLRKQLYADVKQGVTDFEKNHPGTVRKVVCTTVLGALVTVAIDTVVVLTA